MDDKVREYIDAVQDERNAFFNKLQALILRMYPNAQVMMWFGLVTYKVKDGWVALGYRKDGVSLYTGFKDEIAKFKASHPALKTGKGSIAFKVTDAIPVDGLKALIHQVVDPPGKRYGPREANDPPPAS